MLATPAQHAMVVTPTSSPIRVAVPMVVEPLVAGADQPLVTAAPGLLFADRPGAAPALGAEHPVAAERLA